MEPTTSTTLTQAAKDFPAENAYRHQMREGCRESLAHMVIFPDIGRAGFVYPTVLSDGTAKGRATLFGPGLPEPIHEEIQQQVPPELGFEDWRTGPLTMSVKKPHEQVDIAWHGDRIQLSGHYEALHPPYAFSLHPDGNPPYYGDDRTEQHGRFVVDELTVDGRSYEPGESHLVRDHSWGPRVWGLNQHYKWFHAITEDCSIHAFEMQSFGRIEVRGFMHRDGEMHHLVGFDTTFSYDDEMMHDDVVATVTDDAGRTATVTCKAFAQTTLTFVPGVYLKENAVTLDIDGVPGSGWCEFCWNRDYFDFAKEHVAAYG
jgi:hypothetical protein